MSYLGISAGFHDASISVIDLDGNITFAGHSERYSKKKNDHTLNEEIFADANVGCISDIAYYEKPLLKQLRQLYQGASFNWGQMFTRQVLSKAIPPKAKRLIGTGIRTKSYPHHLSHAAAGFQTSPYDRATVVVIDAIGEFDTITIWGAEYDKKGFAKYCKLWSQGYPHSMGLFYSAMTQRVGLKPNEDEYILMGMAAYGVPDYNVFDEFVLDRETIRFRNNLHAGCEDWDSNGMSEFNIAASAQYTLEVLLHSVMDKARRLDWSTNLVYMGGVALNCSANEHLGAYFDNTWIMPNPGDAGSSLGCAALSYGKKINWQHPFLGTNIPGEYPVNALLDELLTKKIVGVASGRAEFGPRALGNRSLLADPRGKKIKDLVNEIKRRQKFRPFAPMILEEYVNDYFIMPEGFKTSPYMQVVARLQNPDAYPAVVHADGTSRVQTVPADCESGVRQLLEKWFVLTGCPMLLNTSLNVKGEPMVNDRADAERFEKLYTVKVCS